MINLARTSPEEFSKLIIDEIANIYENNKDSSKGSYLFIKEDICKIGLLKGKEAFINAADKLCQNSKLPPLEHKDELCMQISKEKDDWVNKEYLEPYLVEKSSYLQYKYFGFHFDLGVVDALTSVVLQIVDDNLFNTQRRNNILNSNYKYIGISNRKVENSFCVYLCFAG